MSRRNSGFTLIEVLVATAIMAAVVAGFYGAFFSIRMHSEEAGRSMDAAAATAAFAEVFSRDIRSAYFDSADNRTSFRGGLEQGRPSLTFTAYSFPSAEGALPSILEISYSVKGDGDAAFVERKVTDIYTRESYATEVTGSITGLDITYYDGKSWTKAWDASIQNGLPVAARAEGRTRGGSPFASSASIKARGR